MCAEGGDGRDLMFCQSCRRALHAGECSLHYSELCFLLVFSCIVHKHFICFYSRDLFLVISFPCIFHLLKYCLQIRSACLNCHNIRISSPCYVGWAAFTCLTVSTHIPFCWCIFSQVPHDRQTNCFFCSRIFVGGKKEDYSPI